ncbi:MAG: ABC transporter permease subunit [Promethearchaeota archaeon]
MIWQIAKKEFHQNIMTFRFIIGTILCILFMTAVEFSLLNEYKTVKDAYNRELKENENNLKNYYVYSLIESFALKPPEPLAIFSEGISKNVGEAIIIKRQEVPYKAFHHILDNPFLGAFQSIDIVLVFKFVMSLLALFFAFDMFSGEKENGTLKLALSTQISRAQFFVGKYVGGILSLTISLSICFITSFLILLFTPFFELTVHVLIRIILIYIVSIFFVTCFYTVGAFISSLTHQTKKSLTISLFMWAILVIVLPNLGNYLATQLKKTEPSRTVEARVQTLEKEFHSILNDYWEKNRPKYITISGGFNFLEGIFEFSIANLEFMNFLDKYIPYSESLRQEYANRIYAIREKHLNSLVYQAKIANLLTIFSPVCLYENITTILAETDIKTHIDFLLQAKRYREQILQYFKTKNVYKKYRFSTIMKRGEPVPVIDVDFSPGSEASQKWESLKKRSTREMRSTLNLDDFPRFRYHSTHLITILMRALPFWSGLTFIILALMLSTYYSFVRYDVR